VYTLVQSVRGTLSGVAWPTEPEQTQRTASTEKRDTIENMNKHKHVKKLHELLHEKKANTTHRNKRPSKRAAVPQT
jgi:hypothetical protein